MHVVINKSGEKSGTHEPSCKDSEPDSVKELSLEQLAQEQSVLLNELSKPLDSVSMPKQLEETKKKVLVIEVNLKAISSANQSERKRLAGVHSTLSQHTNSQQDFVEGSQSLRQELLTLAGKQKQLLDCFTKQKEIGNQVRKLSVQVPKQNELRGVTEMSNHIQQASTNQGPPAVSGDQHTTVIARPMSINKRDLSSLSTLQISRPSSQSGQSIPGSNHKESNHLTTLPTASRVSQKTTHLVQPSAAMKDSRMLPSKLTPSKDLAHPVPLETLIEHGFIEPGVNCLSCVILVRLNMTYNCVQCRYNN